MENAAAFQIKMQSGSSDLGSLWSAEIPLIKKASSNPKAIVTSMQQISTARLLWDTYGPSRLTDEATTELMTQVPFDMGSSCLSI